MIGKFQMQYGAEEFSSGMASSDYANDGALGNSSSLLNPFLYPGAMYALGNPTDKSTNVAGNVIASCESGDSYGGATTNYYRTFIDDKANFYTCNSSFTMTLQKAGSGTYAAGKTDMATLAGTTYITQAADITAWNLASPTTPNETWWTSTKSKSGLSSNVPHPILNYKGVIYFSDANVIHGINSAGTIDTFQAALPLILASQDEVYAMGIDPMTGLILLSVKTTVDISDIFYTNNYIYLWDGVSALPLRKIPTDDLVTSFHNVEGNVYVGQGTSIGQWNGNGVTWLRKLYNTTNSSTSLPYKHHVSHIRNILFMIDGTQVLTYGSVLPGKKGFFYTAADPYQAYQLTHVCGLGEGKLGVFLYNTNLTAYKFFVFDFFTAANGLGGLYFPFTYFPRPVYIRRMRIITTGHTTDIGSGQVSIFDEKGNEVSPQVNTFIVSAGQSPRYVFDFDFSNLKLQGMRPFISFGNTSEGIPKVFIYYDIAE